MTIEIKITPKVKAGTSIIVKTSKDDTVKIEKEGHSHRLSRSVN